MNKDSPSPVRAKQPLEKLIRRKFEDDDIEEEPANQARKDQSPKRVPLKGSINLDEAFD